MVTKHSKRASKELEAKLSSKGVALLSSSSTYLELRQYKNGLASVKKHVCFEIAAFFPHQNGKEKRAAISKLACVSQKRIRSYNVFALGRDISNIFMR